MRGARGGRYGAPGCGCLLPHAPGFLLQPSPRPPTKGQDQGQELHLHVFTSAPAATEPGPPGPKQAAGNTRGINGEHGGFSRLCCTWFCILEGTPPSRRGQDTYTERFPQLLLTRARSRNQGTLQVRTENRSCKSTPHSQRFQRLSGFFSNVPQSHGLLLLLLALFWTVSTDGLLAMLKI